MSAEGWLYPCTQCGNPHLASMRWCPIDGAARGMALVDAWEEIDKTLKLLLARPPAPVVEAIKAERDEWKAKAERLANPRALAYQEQRVAEVTAECAEWKARAEKAEAEIERLRDDVHPDPEIAAEVRAERDAGRAVDKAAGIVEGWHRGSPEKELARARAELAATVKVTEARLAASERLAVVLAKVLAHEGDDCPFDAAAAEALAAYRAVSS